MNATDVPRNARIACRKCHMRKVKCPGGRPCTNCVQSNCADDCTYPDRCRRVKVEQSYIDGLLVEIRRLRRSTQAPSVDTPVDTANEDPTEHQRGYEQEAIDPQESLVQASASGRPTKANDIGPSDPANLYTGPEDAARNPLLEGRPWFFPLTPEMPILISEATDVAFSTRLRQELTGTSQRHFPRIQTVSDEALAASKYVEQAFPNPPRCRFLLKVVLNTLCHRYFIIRKSCTLRLLDKAIADPASCDQLSICKLYALFALGEVYSTRTCLSDEQFPGIGYYVRATRMLSILSEQPRIDCVEILLMLSIYCLAMNRRHSAYCLVGCAVRFSIVIGLHLNVPQHQLPNPRVREHRKRVWWTAYTLDRTWASMLGKPVSISDEDIEVDLPNTVNNPAGVGSNDFEDAEMMIVGIRVANLCAQITTAIYARKSQGGPFSDRVQQALRDLGSWLQELPGPLRAAINEKDPHAPLPVTTLHLYFNQGLILASRPILVYTLRLRRRTSATNQYDASLSISDTVIALSEACIECARCSCRMLTDAWITGTFPTFDFCFTQWLFSASCVLGMSSLSRSPKAQDDGDDLEAAAEILQQLSSNGNLAAREFGEHIVAFKAVIDKIRIDRWQDDSTGFETGMVANGPTRSLPLQEVGISGSLAEPSLEDLLAQPAFDLDFLEPSMLDDSFEAFLWQDQYVGTYDQELTGG